MTYPKFLRPLFLFFLILVLNACTPVESNSIPIEHPSIVRDTETQKTLVENRVIWESQALENYQYTLGIFCNCPSAFDEPVIIEVENGTPVSIRNANSSEEMESKYFSGYDTLDGLFEVIQRAIEAGADEISVRYDASYGYPTNISIDHDKDGIDDEQGFTISNFEIR
ncbi:MAG: hypothetical protein HN855_10235 [Anaerolineae bacterium]|jgi:hypothetical protein|nr:hypothetical protein [Anaerolineae bacterium]MBT7069498.1 hypothetical protein [Anaerolineae bacterium]MBT7325529.1 hypothetical protein [Anaerolineae bacterium]